MFGFGRRAKLRLPRGHYTEKDFMVAVMEYARARGYLCYHTWDSRGHEPGFPDLICQRKGKQVALELKTETGTLRPHQVEWIKAFDQVPGCTARVVRPHDADWISKAFK